MAHLTDIAADHLTVVYDVVSPGGHPQSGLHRPGELPPSAALEPGSGGAVSSPRPMGNAFRSRARLGMPAACPQSLGYGMGVTFYSWSSDQLSQYGTKFVPVTVRDSTYVVVASFLDV